MPFPSRRHTDTCKMCLSIATFAYVGVEIVAASALESAPYSYRARRRSNARAESDLSRRSTDTLIGNTVKFSSMYISLLATIAYSICGLLISFDIDWRHCGLPRLSWTEKAGDERDCLPLTTSAFVAIANESEIPHLGHVFNAFLVFTCLTCAGTNL